MNRTRQFTISKQVVWDAYLKVKKNGGVAGVDNQSIAEFEKNLKKNLYKIWNRMSSGSYFPPPVLTVEIPKKNGGKRKLGLSTIGDRIAQVVAKTYIEGSMEPHFHPNSYGYRPNKSALQAIGVVRQRSWDYDWVIDLDIRRFFDSIDHKLLMKAVRKHTDVKWALLYIERWLEAPEVSKEGKTKERKEGTPQGGIISPLLANLFLHYAFDMWITKEYPQVKFERYADDIVIHCRTEHEAQELLKTIKQRLAECKLEVHPDKTKIVYCKDDNRTMDYPNISYDFLGYTFRPRLVKTKKGRFFVGMNPAVSKQAVKKMRETVRSSNLKSLTFISLKDIARMLNPIIRGWINYYGAYARYALMDILDYINQAIVKWFRKKFSKLLRHKKRACKVLKRMMKQDESLFAHWKVLNATAG